MFQGDLIRLLSPANRLSSVRLDHANVMGTPDNFARVSVDPTLEVLGGLSWGDREFFRSEVSDVIPYFRAQTIGGPLIRECELVSALMAVAVWCRGGTRNVVLCTDNQNVLRWVELAKTQSPVANRILRVINIPRLHYNVDIFPAYVRSEHNIFADGMARWGPGEVEQWAKSEGMTPIGATAQLWAEMELSYNPDMDAEQPPNTFALLGRILHFYKSYDYKICEWRPSHYSVAIVLGTWGYSCFHRPGIRRGDTESVGPEGLADSLSLGSERMIFPY